MTVEQGAFGVAEAPGAPLAPPHRWTDTSPHPWRRYFARSLDLAFLALPCLLVLLYLLGVGLALTVPDRALQVARSLDEEWIPFLAYSLFVPATIPVLALMVGLTGGSIGKWVFGIKVLREDGRPLGFRRALVRELDVWVRGYGVVVPLVSIITMPMSYFRLTEKGKTVWDARQRNLILHRPWGPRDQAIALAVVGAMIVLSIAMRARDLAGR